MLNLGTSIADGIEVARFTDGPAVLSGRDRGQEYVAVFAIGEEARLVRKILRQVLSDREEAKPGQSEEKGDAKKENNNNNVPPNPGDRGPA